MSSVTSNRSCYISAGLDKRNCYSLVVPRGERSPKVFCWSTNPNFRSIISPLFFSFDDNLGIIKIIIYLRAIKTRSKYFFEMIELIFNLKKKRKKENLEKLCARARVCVRICIDQRDTKDWKKRSPGIPLETINRYFNPKHVHKVLLFIKRRSSKRMKRTCKCNANSKSRRIKTLSV